MQNNHPKPEVHLFLNKLELRPSFLGVFEVKEHLFLSSKSYGTI